jgi:hypothetical protein
MSDKLQFVVDLTTFEAPQTREPDWKLFRRFSTTAVERFANEFGHRIVDTQPETGEMIPEFSRSWKSVNVLRDHRRA